MGTFGGAIRLVSIGIVAALLLAGCTPGAQEGDERPVDFGFYTGPIPSPAVLPEFPDLGPTPTPPADTSDVQAMAAYQAALAKYQENVTANQEKITAYYAGVTEIAESSKVGGAAAVAAWQSLLVTAGIAVEGADGTPLEIDGHTGYGWAMTDGELRLHSALATAPGGLRLVDLADAVEAIPELAGADVVEFLRASLSAPTDRGFSAVFSSLSPMTFWEKNFVAKPVDEVVLTWGQVGLVLRRLSAELATWDAAQSGSSASGASSTPQPGFQVSTASFAIQPAAQSKRACELKIDNPWAAELVNQFNKAHSTFVFDMLISHIDDGLESSIGAKLGIARLVSAFAMFASKAAALRATFSLDNAPLVRTKTTQIGELRQLTIKYAFDEQLWEGMRSCMNLFMAPFGLEVPGSQSGAAENIDIDLFSHDPARLRVGDGKGGTKSVNRGRTNAAGESTFTLSGAPQSERIPEHAEPEDVDVALRAVSNLGGNDFFKDIASLPWDAMDAASTGGLSAIPQLLSRMKLLTHTGTVPVRDWSLEVDFQATLSGNFTNRTATNVKSGGGCGVATIRSSTTTVVGLVESEPVDVTALLLTNPEGNITDQAVVFVPEGTDFWPRNSVSGVWMFDLPATYTADKFHAEPGTGTLPPLYESPPSPCAGDGGPGLPQPTPDCGERTYPGLLEVAVPSPRTLYAADKVQSWGELWLECGGRVLSTAPTMASCESPQVSGGKMPPIADIYDSSKTMLEINGSFSCTRTGEGFLAEGQYDWTLRLCRIVDGEPAC